MQVVPADDIDQAIQAIETDGGVRPCFFHQLYPDQGGLMATLNGPEAIRFRRNLDVKTNPVCERCVCTLSL